MRTARIVPVMMVVVAVSLLGVTSASASITQIASFGTTGPGALDGAEGIAVNPNTNNVYVTDKLDHRVVEYDQEGSFILTFGREVNETKVQEEQKGAQVTEAEENICTAASGNTCVDGNAGSKPGQLEWPTGIAVDPTTGDVYVSDGGNERIEKYTPEGAYISQIVSGQNGAPQLTLGIYQTVYEYNTTEFTSFGNDSWVDSEGNLYVRSDSGPFVGFVYKFAPNGAYTGQAFSPNGRGEGWAEPAAVVVSAIGSVYVSEVERLDTGVIEFNRDGEKAGELLGGGSRCASGIGLAVNLFTSEILDVGPTTCETVERVARVFSPVGAVISEFPVHSAPLSPPPGDEHPFIYQALAYATSVGKLYQLSGAGAGQGKVEVLVYGTFPLPTPAVPVVSGEDWSGLGLTAVTLSAKIDPGSTDTEYQIEYGTDPDLSGATSVPGSPVDVGAGFLPVNVSQTLSGLSQSTAYYYRVVAHSSFGGGAGTTVDGPIQGFTTLAPPPSAVTEGASEVSFDAASVSGTVVPGSSGAASGTVWCFQYGTTELPGYNLGFMPGEPAGSAGQGTNPVPVSARLSRLQPDTTYRYRLVAVNSLDSRLSSTACNTEGGQESDGGEGTFTTSSVSVLPVAESGGMLGVSQNAATLMGTVDPLGARTIYYFQIGTDTTYGVDLFGEAGEGSEPEPVSVLISSLQPGTTYHYRLVASNAHGTSYGADESFTTPTFPSSVLAAPPAAPLIGTPDIAFPAEVTGSTTTKRTTPRCKQGKKLSHGKCVKPKTKKKAKQASRSRKER